MALIERLIKRTDVGDLLIPVPDTPYMGISSIAFSALLTEVARGRLTGAQAQSQIEALTGQPLNAQEAQEAQSLVQSITSLATPTAKLARGQEISDVFVLSEVGAPAYLTPQQVRTRLGI